MNAVNFFISVHRKEHVYRDWLSVVEDFVEKLYAAMVAIDTHILRQILATIPQFAFVCLLMQGERFCFHTWCK
jgi:hypothetical protein